jgi:hypothetical protein
MKRVSPAGIFSVFMLLSHGLVRLQTCVPMGNSEMKVEWILLIAPICKSRCGAQTISYVHPLSATKGAHAA